MKSTIIIYNCLCGQIKPIISMGQNLIRCIKVPLRIFFLFPLYKPANQPIHIINKFMLLVLLAILILLANLIWFTSFAILVLLANFIWFTSLATCFTTY